MDTQKKIDLIAETLDYEGVLTPATVLAELDEWDSMGRLSLIVMMDDKLGKALEGAVVREFKIVQDILDFME